MNSGVHIFRPVPSGGAGGGFGSLSTESRTLIWTHAQGEDSDAEAVLPPVSRRFLRSGGMIVHHSSRR
jgi:hypothetical protein